MSKILRGGVHKYSISQILKVVSASLLVLFAVSCKTNVEHEHTFATEWTTDETYHWHAATCEHTEEVSEKSEHTFDEGKVTLEAAETKDGEKTFTCIVCGYKKIEKIPAKGHSFSKGWKTDEANHWHECACGEKTDLTAHEEDEEPEITPATCTAKGVKTYKCKTCGYVMRTEEIEALGHSFDKSKWKSDGTHHFHACIHEGCTEVIDKTEHTFDEYAYNNDATETKKGTKSRTCSECKYIETIPANGPYTATYTFTESAKVLDADTNGTAGAEWTYVEFGDFPKTIAASNVQFNPHADDNGYYAGSDGNYYAKVTVNKYKSTEDTFSDGTVITTGDVKYFKVEPIKWRVLTENYNNSGKALLLAEDVLTANIPYYEDEENNHRNGNNPSNYEHSQIRAYLNGISYNAAEISNENKWLNKGFLQQAFTQSAKEKIADTNLTDWNITDKIFLLSQAEATNEEYGYNEVNDSYPGFIKIATDFAKANYVASGAVYGYDASIWWLRTKDYENSVLISGLRGPIEEYCWVIYQYVGIAPALTIDLP